jgi:putative ABC transport system permease protein
MGILLRDIRYGFRMLLKAPVFSSVAILSLALGIGANTAIFSVINALLIKSLPYAEPEGLALVWGASLDEGSIRDQVSATDVADYRAQNSVFEDVTTYGGWSATLMGEGEPERIQGMQVGDGYFSIMRGSPILGRVFTPEEQQEGNDFVIILSHALWQRRFSGDPDIAGKKIILSGRPYTIVGVMPPEFRPLPQTLVDARAEFYRPVAESYDNEQRSSRHLRAIARLKPGVSVSQAQADLDAIAARLASEYPADNTNYGVRLVTITEDTVGDLRKSLLMLLGAVGCVLLIACANVANLLLARATARHKEMAIRTALGANRGRITRQLLTESLLVAVIGGGLGLLLSLWGTELVEALGRAVFPMLGQINIDWRVLVFTLGTSLLTGILFGLVPALQAARTDLNAGLKEGGRGSGASARSALRGALVVAEVALALVLLVGSGLLIKSVYRLRDVSPGFDARNLLTMRYSLPGVKYNDRAMRTGFYQQAESRLKATGGVEGAGFVSVLPLSRNFDGRGLMVEDYPKPRGEEINVDLYIASPGYLRAMQIPLLQGRGLEDSDGADRPEIVLINETMARALWPGHDPIGKRIKFPGSQSNPQPWRTVVGVVGDVRQYGLDREAPMQIYLPVAQFSTTVMSLVVRTSGDALAMAGAVKKEIHEIDKDLAAFEVATMDELLAETIALRRFSMTLLIIFALVAMSLAAIGIYGVISYSISQGTHELGVRIALGATASDILKLVLKQGMAMTGLGMAIGLVAAYGLTRLLSSLLYDVTATDPATFAIVSALLAGVALAATYIPARRATRIDPMVALRHE